MSKPSWAGQVKKGDWLTIARDMFHRGGQQGLVIDKPDDEGVSLDFFRDCFGDPKGIPTIEFFEWDELEPLDGELL